MLILRSALFALGQTLAAIVCCPIALAAWPLPPRTRSRVIGLWARFTIWWLRHTCGLTYRVEGATALPAQPAVVLAKHQSAWDTIAFQLIFPPQAWVLKKELLYIPFFGWGLAASHPIAINRKQGGRALNSLVRQGLGCLREGRWVVVFPEGNRTAPGERGRYKAGGAMLAVKAGAPIVPVAHNAGSFWPRRSFIKRAGVITVRIGPVIETRGRQARQANALAEEWIEAQMPALRPGRRPAPPGSNPQQPEITR